MGLGWGFIRFMQGIASTGDCADMEIWADMEVNTDIRGLEQT